jgi:hypothetical protein
MPSPAIDNRQRTFLCRGSPARGMTTGASAARLQTSRTAAHLLRRHVSQSPTTTEALMKAQTSTLTLHHFFGGRHRTLQLRPCCCAAARSRQPLRNDGSPAAKGAARSCGSTASGELRLAPALGARAG